MTDGSNADSFRTRIASGDVRTVLRWTIRVAFVLLLLPFVVFAAPQLVGAEASYVVLSDSMEPAISGGDVVIVDAVAPEAISTGDVITYGGSASDPPTTHRVIDIEEGENGLRFQTQGDNNDAPDSATVPAEAVHGRVMEVSVPAIGSMLFVIPFIGYVIQWGGTFPGFLLLVVLPLTALAAMGLWPGRGATDGADVTDAGSEPTEAGPDASGSNTVLTVAPWQVTLGVGLLSAIGVLVGRRALETQGPLETAVAVGAVTGAALLVRFVALTPQWTAPDSGTDASPPSGADSDDQSPRLVTASSTAGLRRGKRVTVASLSALEELAAGSSPWIVHDLSRDEYILPGDGVTYAVPRTDGPEQGSDGGDDAADRTVDSVSADVADLAATDADEQTESAVADGSTSLTARPIADGVGADDDASESMGDREPVGDTDQARSTDETVEGTEDDDGN